MKISVTVDINPDKILDRLGMGTSNTARRFLASEVVRLCDPYVPFRQGTLKNGVVIAPDGSAITYPGPYAHYQYIGKVMGPNIPIKKGGMLVGFYSKGPKQCTGKDLQYHGAPMRGPQWDKRMMANRRGDLEQSLAKYVGGKIK